MGPSDEARWLEAERRISPERRRANRRRWLLVVLAAIAYSVIAGVLRAVLSSGDDPAPSADSAPPTTLWIGLAVATAGMLLVLGGLIAGFATRRLRPTWERVDGALNWRQTRSVRLQIRGRRPVSERHRAVVRAIAEQDIRTATGLEPCYLGAALMVAGLLIGFAVPEIIPLIAGLLVLLGAAAIWQYGFTVRAARSYLRAN